MSPRANHLMIVKAVICLSIACSASAEAPAPNTAEKAHTLRMLFVGNSLSFFNNGTYKVVAHLLSQQFPNTAIEAVQIAEPDELLSEHLSKARTPGTYEYAALGPESTEKWDYVILQEESEQIALEGENAMETRKAIAGLARLAAARGARVGVVLTWAWLDGKNHIFPSFEDMQNKVNGGYTDLVQAVRKETKIPVFMAPIGLAWQAVHGILFQQAAEEHLQNSTRAAAALASTTGVTSFVTVPKPKVAARPAAATDVTGPNLALLNAICGRREAPSAPAPDLPPAGTPPAGSLGLPWTSITAGRKLLSHTASSRSRREVAVEQMTHDVHALAESAHQRRLQQTDAPKTAAAAGSPGLPLTVLITQINASDTGALAPAPGDVSAQGPRVTVPAISGGDPVLSAISLPPQSATAPSTHTPGHIIDICKASEYPAGWNTFKQMYDKDGNHPTDEGTYLEGLVIASAMTGCRMLGNPYDKGIDSKWVSFLQEISDAVMFRTTPPAFPQDLWAPRGVQCTLK